MAEWYNKWLNDGPVMNEKSIHHTQFICLFPCITVWFIHWMQMWAGAGHVAELECFPNSQTLNSDDPKPRRSGGTLLGTEFSLFFWVIGHVWRHSQCLSSSEEMAMFVLLHVMDRKALICSLSKGPKVGLLKRAADRIPSDSWHSASVLYCQQWPLCSHIMFVLDLQEVWRHAV